MKSDPSVIGSFSNSRSAAGISRRHALKLFTGAVAAVALGKFMGDQSVSAAGAYYQTTFALNLRAKASLDSAVLDVIPAWELVLDGQESTDDFIAVEWNGQSGWAKRAYLIPANPRVTRELSATMLTNDSVNFRQGPSLDAEIWRELPKGTPVVVSYDVVFGFTYVEVEGQEGWIWSDYLMTSGPSAGPELSTTSRLNLRATPALDGKILLVMPEGASVLPGPTTTNGFQSVTYGDVSGWAWAEFLA